MLDHAFDDTEDDIVWKTMGINEWFKKVIQKSLALNVTNFLTNLFHLSFKNYTQE